MFAICGCQHLSEMSYAQAEKNLEEILHYFAEYLKEENKDLLYHIFEKINEVAKIVGVDKTGYRVISNVGEDAGQAVKHLHFHILGGEKLPTR